MVLLHDLKQVAFINAAGVAMLGANDATHALGLPVRALWEPNGSGLTDEEVEHGSSPPAPRIVR